jgi:hypothetical protein
MLLRPLLAASAVLLVALPARAERPHDAVTLEYLPSPAAVALCPEAGFLALEVRLRLGYELVQRSAPNHLTVKVDRAEGRFRSIGEMRDDAGNVILAKTHSEIDCTAALISMAISVSIKFTRPPEPSEPPEPPEPSPPVTDPPEEPEPAELPPPSPPTPEPAAPTLPERRRFEAGVTSVFSIGLAPSVLGGVGWFVGVRWPAVSVALEGRALFAPDATIAQATTRDGYHFSFAAISGVGCYRRAWALGCLRAEAGSLWLGGDGTVVNFGRVTVADLGFRVGAEWPVTPWLAIRAYADASFRLHSTILQLVPSRLIVWRQPLLSGSAGLGPIFTFPGG